MTQQCVRCTPTSYSSSFVATIGHSSSSKARVSSPRHSSLFKVLNSPLCSSSAAIPILTKFQRISGSSSLLLPSVSEHSANCHCPTTHPNSEDPHSEQTSLETPLIFLGVPHSTQTSALT